MSILACKGDQREREKKKRREKKAMRGRMELHSTYIVNVAGFGGGITRLTPVQGQYRYRYRQMHTK